MRFIWAASSLILGTRSADPEPIWTDISTAEGSPSKPVAAKKKKQTKVEPDHAPRTFDHLENGVFQGVALEMGREDGQYVLKIVQTQSFNTFSECTEEYKGLESQTFVKYDVGVVLEGIEYVPCDEPAESLDLLGAYKLQDNIEVTMSDLQTMTIKCQYQQTGTKRIITLRRSSRKYELAYLDPAMWRRLKAREGQASTQARECNGLLHTFIDIQNGMAEQYMKNNPDKNASRLVMPRIKSSKDKPAEATTNLAPGYIVLIIFSVFAVLGIAWFAISKLSKKKPASIEPSPEAAKKEKKPKKKPRNVPTDQYDDQTVIGQPIGRPSPV